MIYRIALVALFLVAQHFATANAQTETTLSQSEPLSPKNGLLTIFVAPVPADKVLVVRDARGAVIDRVAPTSPIALQYEVLPGAYSIDKMQRAVKEGEQTGIMIGFGRSPMLQALELGAVPRLPPRLIRPADNLLSFSVESVGRPGTDDPGPMTK